MSMQTVKYLSSLALLAAVVVGPSLFLASWASEMTQSKAMAQR